MKIVNVRADRRFFGTPDSCSKAESTLYALWLEIEGVGRKKDIIAYALEAMDISSATEESYYKFSKTEHLVTFVWPGRPRTKWPK